MGGFSPDSAAITLSSVCGIFRSNHVYPSVKIRLARFVSIALSAGVDKVILESGIIIMNAAGAFLLFLASISEWFGREEPGVVENQRPYLILVEGNVGSGKSTTLDFLSDSSRRDDVEVVFEPVAEWQNVSGTDLLQKMFDKSSARRWNGVFQTYTSLTRYRNVLKPAEKRVRIMERSVFSEHACFLQNTMDMGVISDVEYCLQGRWFSFLTDKLWDKVKPDLIGKRFLHFLAHFVILFVILFCFQST